MLISISNGEDESDVGRTFETEVVGWCGIVGRGVMIQKCPSKCHKEWCCHNLLLFPSHILLINFPYEWK